MRTHAPQRPQRLAAPDKLTVPRELAAPDVRMSADHPGAAIEDVRGPTRTKVSIPETEEKLLPGAEAVNVPGPINGSRLTKVKVPWQ